MPREVNQMSLWDVAEEQLLDLFCSRNGLGPFYENPGVIARDFDCQNYNACLTFVTKTGWKSFTCVGCHKVANMRWKECRM